MVAYINISSSTPNDLSLKISQLLNMVNIQRYFGKGIRGKSDTTLKTAVCENVKSGLQNMSKVESV